MRILTWNLFHGRAQPGRPREHLLTEFADAIAGWDWDVALLQEVPPWWPLPLARASDASGHYAVRTARTELMWCRRRLATWRPELMKSAGGGVNAILVRPAAGAITARARRRLRWRPERRVVQAVLLAGGAGDGLWIANIHAQVRPHLLTRADLEGAGAALRRWSGGGPALLGGDLNVPDPDVEGFTDLGGHGVDRVLAHGPLQRVGAPRRLARGDLSDHAPVLIEVERV